MLDFVCAPMVSPFCVSAEYAPVTSIGSLRYQGGLPGVAADPGASERLGVSMSFGRPDVGRPVAASELRRFCRGATCVTFKMTWETPTRLAWDLAVPDAAPGRYTLWNFVVVEASSEARMRTALDNVALSLTGGELVTLTDLERAEALPAPNE